MPDIYDQDLEGLAAAEETQTQEAQTALKNADKPQAQAETKASATAQPDDSVKLNKEEYADFQRMRQAAQLSQMETDFRKSYPDFDMQKITDKILEMDEKNPGIGDALLTPVGIENVYLKFFHGKAQAQGTGGGVSIQELIGKINKGEASDSEKQAFYSRFF